MARDYVIQVTGALRTERTLLDTEHDLAEELREATRQVGALLLAAAKEAAPTPRKGALAEDAPDSKGHGINVDLNFPGAPGGQRRLAGRAPGGAPLVGLTYQVALGVEGGNLAAYREQGTGLFGPVGAKYPIYPNPGTQALYLRDWDGRIRGGGDFRGGEKGEKLPIFEHVMHPGVRPRPFLEDTVRAHSEDVDAIYEHAVERAVRGF